MRSTELSRLVIRGLELHRDGKIDEAGRVYAEVLESDPLRADALHLFGIVLFQLGDAESAVDAISRAIALWPNKAHFHVNLGEVYRALGLENLAMGSDFLALKLRPDRFESLDDIDIILKRGGPFDEVRMPPRVPAPPAPPEAAAASETGFRLRSEGDLGRALDHFAAAVRHAPGLGLPLSHLGQALLEVNRPGEALAYCLEAVRQAPEIPETWSFLGNVYFETGRSVEARSSYLQALRLAPDEAPVLNSLGRVLAEAICPVEAQAWFRMAMEFCPDSAEIRSNLAWVLREVGEFDEAIEICRATLEFAPNSPETHLCLGSIQHDLRKYQESRRHFDLAIQGMPTYLLAHLSQGILLKELGDLDGAERAFREVIRLPGDHSRAYAGLTDIYRGRLPDADLEAIQRMLAQPELPARPRVELNYAIAQVYDARSEFVRAAEHVRAANEIRRATSFQSGRASPAGDHEQFVEQMIDVCTPDFFDRIDGFGLSTTRPVFVCGLPRSGTSLTEQILASHSKVLGLGEAQLVREHFESLPKVMGTKDDAITCLSRIDRETSDRISRSHLARLDAIDDLANFLVDKFLDTYLYLGFVATLFPNARFIHCRRDLRDTAVSCWSTNFWYLDWASDIDAIASRFAMHQRIMEHWEQTLPIPILHVDYEDTVNDLETTARTLLDWCELEWEPACLNFHESKRVVRTASVTQVRQPVHRRSVERWRNYEAELGPLFEQLEGFVKV